MSGLNTDFISPKNGSTLSLFSPVLVGGTGTLSGCAISGSTLTGCNISGGTLSGETVVNCSISGGAINNIVINNVTISGSGTEGGAQFTGATMSGCDFIGGSIGGSTITGGSISGVTLAADCVYAYTQGTFTMSGYVDSNASPDVAVINFFYYITPPVAHLYFQGFAGIGDGSVVSVAGWPASLIPPWNMNLPVQVSGESATTHLTGGHWSTLHVPTNGNASITCRCGEGFHSTTGFTVFGPHVTIPLINIP